MNCKAIQKLSIRYELGEVDILEKALFERHIKRCPVCNKKYKSLILMGTLFAISRKTPSSSIVKNFLSLTMVKVTIIVTLIGGSLFTINKLGENVTVNLTPTIANDLDEIKAITKQSNKKDTIRIISINNDKSLEINIDKKNLEIKNRLIK